MPVNPRYYERMSKMLDALIEERRRQALEYKEYLRRIIELTKRIKKPESSAQYPEKINTPALRALFDNIEESETIGVSDVNISYGKTVPPDFKAELALLIDKRIQEIKKDNWRGNKFKEREVRNAIRSVIKNKPELVDKLFEIVKNQHEY